MPGVFDAAVTLTLGSTVARRRPAVAVTVADVPFGAIRRWVDHTARVAFTMTFLHVGESGETTAEWLAEFPSLRPRERMSMTRPTLAAAQTWAADHALPWTPPRPARAGAA